MGSNILAAYTPILVTVVPVRLVNVVIAGYKFHILVLGLHTWENKLTGLLVYMAPLLVMACPPERVFMFVCLVAILSAVEEECIRLDSRKLDLNRMSLFLKE